MTNNEYLHCLFSEYNEKIKFLKDLDVISVKIVGIDSEGHTQYVDFKEDVAAVFMEDLLRRV